MRHAICFALALGGGTPAIAAPAAFLQDGDELLRHCTATVGAYMNYCFGYVDAIADALLDHEKIAGVEACIPEPLPDDPTLRNIVVTYLRREDVFRPRDAAVLVARALAETYPCKDKPLP